MMNKFELILPAALSLVFGCTVIRPPTNLIEAHGGFHNPADPTRESEAFAAFEQVGHKYLLKRMSQRSVKRILGDPRERYVDGSFVSWVYLTSIDRSRLYVVTFHKGRLTQRGTIPADGFRRYWP